MRSGADLNRSGAPFRANRFPDNRRAPARDEAGPPGFEPGPARLELAMLPVTPRACEERTARIERASPEWRSGALPAELRPRGDTPGWIRTSVPCRRRAALCPLSYGRRGASGR